MGQGFVNDSSRLQKNGPPLSCFRIIPLSNHSAGRSFASVHRLRQADHDVVRIESGETDSAVLEVARSESRIVVTYDRDFGFLVFRTLAPIPPGIVYFRSQPVAPESTALELLAIMNTPGVVLEGRLTVVEPGRIRQRPLPQA
jgi:predicted nuclease of predicted toxin-antitoxin system